jgi:hypothetical protein
MAQKFELGQVPEQFKKEGFQFSTPQGSKFQFKQAGGRLQPVRVQAQPQQVSQMGTGGPTEEQIKEIARRTSERRVSSAGVGDPTEEQRKKIAELTSKRKEAETPTKTGPTATDQFGGVVEPEGESTLGLSAEAKQFFDLLKEQTEQQSKAAKRGIGAGGTTTAGAGVDFSQFGQAGDVLNQQALLAQEVAGGKASAAASVFNAKEQQIQTELIATLGATNIGQALAQSGVDLKGMSNQQLQGLLKNPNLELSDRMQERLTAEGDSALESISIQRNAMMANNEYSQNQLERNFDRAISEREKFNQQQDNKLRRLAASFGGGKVESLGNNVAIMKAAEEGQKAVDFMRGDFIDKKTLLSSQANTIIDTYHNNKRLIEGEMAGILEDKFAEINNTVNTLMNQGVTNQAELQTNIATAKKEYMDMYSKVTDKAISLINTENERLFQQQERLAQQQFQIDRDRQQNIFQKELIGLRDKLGRPVSRFGETGFTSTPTTNTSGMQTVSTEEANAGNCVLWSREQVPNLPFGLFSKADKQRAIQLAGNSDMSQVQVGDCILTAEGESGHAAVVKSINEDGTLTLKEANYNAGQVTEGRTIAFNDSNIYGFVRPGMAPAENTGGNADLEGTNAGIQSQIDEATQVADFVPQTELDREALAFVSEESSIADLKSRGFEDFEIDQVVLRARELRQRGVSVDTGKFPDDIRFSFNEKIDISKIPDLGGKQITNKTARQGNLPFGITDKQADWIIDHRAGNVQFQQLKSADIKSLNDLIELREDIAELRDLKTKVDTGPLASKKLRAERFAGFESEDFNKLEIKSGKQLAQFIKEISGAAVSEQEAQRLAQLVPNVGMQDTQFVNAIDDLEDDLNSLIDVKLTQFDLEDEEELVSSIRGVQESPQSLEASGGARGVQASQVGFEETRVTVQNEQGDKFTIPQEQLQEAINQGFIQI